MGGVIGEKRDKGGIYKSKKSAVGPGSYEIKGMGNVKRPNSATTFGGRAK